MKLVRLHECLCDLTRLRIVHLLLQGPLCVCHLQDIIGEPQAKVSRHMAYLRRSDMVKTKRSGKWIVYRLTEKRPHLLEANLACLQDCAGEEAVFRRDLQKLAKLGKKPGTGGLSCASPARPTGNRRAIAAL